MYVPLFVIILYFLWETFLDFHWIDTEILASVQLLLAKGNRKLNAFVCIVFCLRTTVPFFPLIFANFVIFFYHMKWCHPLEKTISLLCVQSVWLLFLVYILLTPGLTKTLNRNEKNWLPFTLQMLPWKISLNIVLVVMFLLMSISEWKKNPFQAKSAECFYCEWIFKCFLLQ